MNTGIQSILIVLTLLFSGLSPKAQAVVPPPDGGYPGFNTAEGQNALFSLTTGAANTAVGWRSLFSDTTGSFNTGVGAGALLLNTADENTGFGAAALQGRDQADGADQRSNLRPQAVSFRYKPEIEPTRPVGFGLIAEDVEKISPDLVTR
jgi:hypothetical protein